MSDTCSPALPTGTAENDLMIATLMGPTSLSTGNWIETAVGGWNLVYNQGETAGDDRTTAVYYKIAGASESAPTFDNQRGSSSSKSCMIHTFRGINTTTPLDVAFSAGSHYATSSNTHNPTNPAITTATANSWVFIVHFHTGNTLSTPAAPSGYTIRRSMAGASYNHMQQEVATKAVASPGTETPGAWTNDSGATTNDGSLATLAIREASVAAPGAAILRRRN